MEHFAVYLLKFRKYRASHIDVTTQNNTKGRVLGKQQAAEEVRKEKR